MLHAMLSVDRVDRRPSTVSELKKYHAPAFDSTYQLLCYGMIAIQPPSRLAMPLVPGQEPTLRAEAAHQYLSLPEAE